VWQKTRRRKLRQQPWCKFRSLGGCRAPLDVHHRTYERLGHERMSDLDVVCRRHHDLWHALQDIDRWMTKKVGRDWRKKVPLRRAIAMYTQWVSSRERRHDGSHKR
jgi:hypothetical protein